MVSGFIFTLQLNYLFKYRILESISMSKTTIFLCGVRGIIYLHGSPVIRQKGYCISQVSKVFNSCAIAIVLCHVAACYVVTCQIFQAPEHWYLFVSRLTCLFILILIQSFMLDYVVAYLVATQIII